MLLKFNIYIVVISDGLGVYVVRSISKVKGTKRGHWWDYRGVPCKSVDEV